MQQTHFTKPYDPAQDAAELLTRLAYLLLFIGLPMGAEFSRRATFLIFPIAIALFMGAALLTFTSGQRKQLFRFEANGLWASAGFLVLWSGLSLLWVSSFGENFGQWVKIVLTIGFTLASARLMAPHTRISNVYVLSVGLALSLLVALALLQRKALDGTVIFDGRAGITFAVLVWPAVAALNARSRIGWAGALAIMVAMLLMLTGKNTSFIILGLGALAFSASLSSRMLVARVLGLVFATLIILAPLLPILLSFMVSDTGDDMFSQSLAMVKQVGISDGARLITGRGFGAASQSPLAENFPFAAHNLLFETWYDLGILGALAMGALVQRCFAMAGAINSSIGSFLIGALSVIVLFGIFGQGFTLQWWVNLLCACTLAFVSVANGLYRQQRPSGMTQAPLPG